MLPLLAGKAVISLAVAGWLAVSGAQVAIHEAGKGTKVVNYIGHEIVNYHKENAKPPKVGDHLVIKHPKYKGEIVITNPAKYHNRVLYIYFKIVPKPSQKGLHGFTEFEQPWEDILKYGVKRVPPPAPPKTTRDHLADLFGNWVYWLGPSAYDYVKQQWVPANDPAIKQQEQENRAWWRKLSPGEKRRYAEFITKRGHTVDETLKDLEKEYR